MHSRQGRVSETLLFSSSLHIIKSISAVIVSTCAHLAHHMPRPVDILSRSLHREKKVLYKERNTGKGKEWGEKEGGRKEEKKRGEAGTEAVTSQLMK